MFRQLGIHDQMINSIGAYKKIRNNNAIGLEVKFSSAGKYFSHNLGPYFSGKNIPTESLVSLAIARKWTNNFSGAFTLKFIHSNIGYSYAIFFDQGRNLEPGRALATDFSLTYEAPLTIDNNTSKLRFGLAITNLGTPISYSNDLSREYLPANIGFGVAWTTRLNTENNISFLADINKLLVPSPQSCTGLICSHAVQPSVVRTALFSFGDAQGGISEELSEIYYSVGLEYDYLKKIFLRTGYLYEHPEKGNRQSLALGIGYAYRNIVADFSLQIPLIETETIDNRYRFSISYSWSKTKKSE